MEIKTPNETEMQLIQKLNLIADSDGVISSLASKDLSTYEKLSYICKTPQAMVDWVKVNCNKFLHIRAFNEAQYFRHVIQVRNYLTMDEQTGRLVFDTVKIVKELGTLNDNRYQLKQFLAFHERLSNYARKHDEQTLQEFCNEKYNILVVNQRNRFNKNIAKVVDYIAKFADENNCVDSIKDSPNEYVKLTKTLNGFYKPQNFNEYVPILQQFVENETDYHFSVNYVNQSAVEYIKDKLKEFYPNGKIEGLSSDHYKLYQKICYLRDVFIPGASVEKTVNQLFGMDYVGGKGSVRTACKGKQNNPLVIRVKELNE